jgi:hypothetical protein
LSTQEKWYFVAPVQPVRLGKQAQRLATAEVNLLDASQTPRCQRVVAARAFEWLCDFDFVKVLPVELDFAP